MLTCEEARSGVLPAGREGLTKSLPEAPVGRAVRSPRDGKPPVCALSRPCIRQEPESPALSAAHPPRSWCTWSAVPSGPSLSERSSRTAGALPAATSSTPSGGRRQCRYYPATTPDGAVRILRCAALRHTRRGRTPTSGNPAPSRRDPSYSDFGSLIATALSICWSSDPISWMSGTAMSGCASTALRAADLFTFFAAS